MMTERAKAATRKANLWNGQESKSILSLVGSLKSWFASRLRYSYMVCSISIKFELSSNYFLNYVLSIAMIGDILSYIGQNKTTLGIPAMAGRTVLEQNTLSGSCGQGLQNKPQEREKNEKNGESFDCRVDGECIGCKHLGGRVSNV